MRFFARTLMGLAVTVFLALDPQSAAAQNAPGAELARLLDQGDYDEARRVMASAVADAPQARLHRTTLEGVILVREGQLAEAIALFRAILAINPDFVPARVELGRALRLAGQDDAASHHFELLAQGTDNPALRALATGALNAIRRDRPYGASMRFSIAPSTNFNRGSTEDAFAAGDLVFSIDPESRAQSGLGLTLGGSAFRRLDLDESTGLVLSSEAEITHYSDSAYDTAVLGAAAKVTHHDGDRTVSVGPVVEYQWSGWAPYRARYGLESSLSAPIAPRTLASARVRAVLQEYHESDYRNGPRLSGTLALRHALSTTTTASVSLGGVIERTERAHLDRNDVTLGAALRHEWRGGLMTTVFGSYEHHSYLGAYPGMDAPRRDHELSIGATVSHRKLNLGGFMPEITYSYTRQFSNVSFFENDSHDLRLSLTKAF